MRVIAREMCNYTHGEADAGRDGESSVTEASRLSACFAVHTGGAQAVRPALYADAAPTTWPEGVVPCAADPWKGALYEKTPPSAAARR